ncbi:ABC transporter permease [Chitinophaga sp. Cy-1792]|uniref:ABC transporter permease n=1 Tax=Chitinophaga sp. Cy-1792 TaxID=2608339 RepID=UPI0014210011|nr:ABC transporter permease [Chitinophaga sp. Cy-1792]NIG53139.1 hypothetical protein [Chitinophaga sp. Cy-1792]
MKNIILTEWLKVKSYRTFWIMVVLAAIVPLAGNLLMADFFTTNLKAAKNLVGDPFSFPDVWLTTASICSYVSSLYGLLLIILVTNEFTFRTNRQNIIDGWDRKEFVYSKLFWLLKLAGLSLLVATISAIFVGLKYGTTSISFEGYQYVVIYFLQMLVLLTIALLIAVFFRRAGISIVVFMAYTMMLEQIIVSILKKYVGLVGGLLPLQTGDELIPFPLTGKLIQSDQYNSSVYVVVMIAYIFLGIWLVFRKIMKSDL